MTRIVTAAVDDMFFASKIRETAKALGLIVNFPRGQDVLMATINEDRPHLIVVDLHSRKFSAFELANELKADEKLRAIPLLGFYSHVETETQRKALQAGYDEVLPRSLFFRELANILAGESRNKIP